MNHDDESYLLVIHWILHPRLRLHNFPSFRLNNSNFRRKWQYSLSYVASIDPICFDWTELELVIIIRVIHYESYLVMVQFYKWDRSCWQIRRLLLPLRCQFFYFLFYFSIQIIVQRRIRECHGCRCRRSRCLRCWFRLFVFDNVEQAAFDVYERNIRSRIEYLTKLRDPISHYESELWVIYIPV